MRSYNDDDLPTSLFGRRRVFRENHLRDEFVAHIVEFLITFIDGDLAHIADAVNILLGYGEVAHTRNEIYNSRRDTMRRILGNQVLLFNKHRDELA